MDHIKKWLVDDVTSQFDGLNQELESRFRNRQFKGNQLTKKYIDLYDPKDWIRPEVLHTETLVYPRCLQIINFSSSTEKAAKLHPKSNRPVYAVLGDGYHAIKAIFNPKWIRQYEDSNHGEKFTSCQTGTVLQITKYHFFINECCQLSWLNGVLMEEQQNVVRKSKDGQIFEKRFTRVYSNNRIQDVRLNKYAILCQIRNLDDLGIRKQAQIYVDEFKVITSGNGLVYGESTDISDVPDIKTRTERMPLIPTTLPTKEDWIEVLEEVVKQWMLERSFGSFFGSLDHKYLFDRENIRAFFMRSFTPNTLELRVLSNRMARLVVDFLYENGTSLKTISRLPKAFLELRSMLPSPDSEYQRSITRPCSRKDIVLSTIHDRRSESNANVAKHQSIETQDNTPMFATQINLQTHLNSSADDTTNTTLSQLNAKLANFSPKPLSLDEERTHLGLMKSFVNLLLIGEIDNEDSYSGNILIDYYVSYRACNIMETLRGKDLEKDLRVIETVEPPAPLTEARKRLLNPYLIPNASVADEVLATIKTEDSGIDYPIKQEHDIENESGYHNKDKVRFQILADTREEEQASIPRQRLDSTFVPLSSPPRYQDEQRESMQNEEPVKLDSVEIRKAVMLAKLEEIISAISGTESTEKSVPKRFTIPEDQAILLNKNSSYYPLPDSKLQVELSKQTKRPKAYIPDILRPHDDPIEASTPADTPMQANTSPLTEVVGEQNVFTLTAQETSSDSDESEYSWPPSSPQNFPNGQDQRNIQGIDDDDDVDLHLNSPPRSSLPGPDDDTTLIVANPGPIDIRQGSHSESIPEELHIGEVADNLQQDPNRDSSMAAEGDGLETVDHKKLPFNTTIVNGEEVGTSLRQQRARRTGSPLTSMSNNFTLPHHSPPKARVPIFDQSSQGDTTDNENKAESSPAPSSSLLKEPRQLPNPKRILFAAESISQAIEKILSSNELAKNSDQVSTFESCYDTGTEGMDTQASLLKETSRPSAIFGDENSHVEIEAVNARSMKQNDTTSIQLSPGEVHIALFAASQQNVSLRRQATQSPPVHSSSSVLNSPTSAFTTSHDAIRSPNREIANIDTKSDKEDYTDKGGDSAAYDFDPDEEQATAESTENEEITPEGEELTGGVNMFIDSSTKQDHVAVTENSHTRLQKALPDVAKEVLTKSQTVASPAAELEVSPPRLSRQDKGKEIIKDASEPIGAEVCTSDEPLVNNDSISSYKEYNMLNHVLSLRGLSKKRLREMADIDLDKIEIVDVAEQNRKKRQAFMEEYALRRPPHPVLTLDVDMLSWLPPAFCGRKADEGDKMDEVA